MLRRSARMKDISYGAIQLYTQTTLRGRVTYSRKSQPIIVYTQVLQAIDWWTPKFSVVGIIGYGSLTQDGIISGKVTEEMVMQNPGLNHSSEPALL